MDQGLVAVVDLCDLHVHIQSPSEIWMKQRMGYLDYAMHIYIEPLQDGEMTLPSSHKIRALTAETEHATFHQKSMRPGSLLLVHLSPCK